MADRDMMGAEKPLSEALRPGAKLRLVRTRDRGGVQQILLLEPPELAGGASINGQELLAIERLHRSPEPC
jgi:hypothetical protein